MPRISILGSLFGTLADSLYTIGSVWLILEATGSGLQVTLVSVISGLISLAFMPLAGLWLDGRHGWTLILGSDLFRLLAALIASCVTLLSLPSVGLWIGVLGFAIANAFYVPVQQVLIARLTSGDTRAIWVARMKSAVRSARIAGPAIGGIASEMFGVFGLSILAIIALSGSFVCNLLLRRRIPSLDLQRAPQSIRADMAETLAYIAKSRSLVTVALIGVTVNLAHSTFVIALPIVIDGQQGGDGATYGLLLMFHNLAALGAMLALSVKFIGRKVRATPHNIAGSLAVLALGFFVLSGGMSSIAAAVALIGVGVAAASVLSETRMSLGTPEHMQSRIFASIQAAALGLRPMGIVLGGWMASSSSYYGLALANGVVMLGLAGWTAIRKT